MLESLNAAMVSRRFLKAISGIDCFDTTVVRATALAAAEGGADALDVAADPELVREAREAAPGLAIFASSVVPEVLVASGADVLEIGNYDALYRAGEEPTAREILEWTRRTVALARPGTPVCVTLPGRASLAESIDLAVQLQAAGASILQVEGIMAYPEGGLAGSLRAMADALQVVSAVSGVVEIPVFLAGGVDAQSAPHALASGACGIGIGRALRAAGSVEAGARLLRQLRQAMERVGVPGKGLRLQA
ncbi:MAG: DUF561 domain-containing protein [Candidatus Sericytochromatia bacterium]|nr:DUF561 domain-containing protein [Candidatus Sericytochromatia bacterium]